MSLFAGLNQNDNLELEEEKIGGGSYISQTGVYDFVIEKAYGGQSDSGAYFIDVTMKTKDDKKLQFREYITSGKEKGIRPYYIDKQGKQKPLPGYAKINALDVLLTGNSAQYPLTETKQIPLYNKEAGKEVLTPAEVVTGWIGKPVSALVRMVRDFKQAKNEATGKWENTSDTKEYAEIVHFIDPVTGQTRAEKLAGSEAKVKAQFEAKFKPDFVLDKTKGKATAATKTTAESEAPANPFGNK
jgi:hypothetical protein